ncbi:MAG: metal ABC transporter permease [Chlamydiae bacterium]|nr:metal ABC transporter permease [Chlamydiota bacterium]
MNYSLVDFFTDPVLRAPTLGSIFMCLSSSLAGVIVVIRKRSLLGESLSHASYPGIALGVTLLASFFSPSSDGFAIAVLFCAFISSLLGMLLIDLLQKRFSVKDDAALCFVLSSFFGLGVLIASRIQTTHALWYKQVQGFLYGQTATMQDIHIVIYAALLFVTISVVVLLYREIQMLIFDKAFGQSIGINFRLVEIVILLLTVLAIVIGIRSVGIVMMAGMLIAPALAARQLTQSLKFTFLISGIIGALSGFLGNYFSVMIPYYLHAEKLSLPTGPMILLVASFICLLALLFAPQKGLITRMLRVIKFRRNCQLENILKALWKDESRGVTLKEVSSMQNLSSIIAFLRVRKLASKGWLDFINKRYFLSTRGKSKAREIVRLHRLWELYLVHLGAAKDKVHASAEEMEHVLTPDLEKQLTELLNDPLKDPHDQPIPHRGDPK